MFLKGIHHIAIICSDIERSKRFYTEILGFEIVREVFREERNSFKLDLTLNGHYVIDSSLSIPLLPAPLALKRQAYVTLPSKFQILEKQ